MSGRSAKRRRKEQGVSIQARRDASVITRSVLGDYEAVLRHRSDLRFERRMVLAVLGLCIVAALVAVAVIP